MLPLIPTTLVGSYPQPDWLIDRDRLLDSLPPRVRAKELWRVPEPYLAQAQDDATALAIRDLERVGLDILTDGEIRRESYSNRFATALEGLDIQPGDGRRTRRQAQRRAPRGGACPPHATGRGRRPPLPAREHRAGSRSRGPSR
jgi:methionine synthase II (cobalamin-independent)